MSIEEIYLRMSGLRAEYLCLNPEKKEDKYIKSELEGRTAFLAYIIDNKELLNNITGIEFSGLYDDYDVRIDTKNTIQLVEIKKRDINSNNYSTDLLELNKLYKMYCDCNSIFYKNEAETEDKRKISYYYYNFFNDNKLVKYKLDYNKMSREYKIDKLMMQHTTATYSEKILKDVIFLDRNKEQAEIINLN